MRFFVLSIIGSLLPSLCVSRQITEAGGIQQQAPKAATESPDKPELARLIVMALGAQAEISVKGLWRPDHPTKQNELNEAVTALSCFAHGGKDFVGTEAFCLGTTATILDSAVGTLDVSTNWLKVVEWNSTQVVATDDSSICVTSQTIFDLKRKTVIALDVRKPEAQGLFDSCKLLPDRQTYYLQDVADYYGKKWARATSKSEAK